MKNPFEKIFGKSAEQPEQQENPIDEARKAIVEHLEYLKNDPSDLIEESLAGAFYKNIEEQIKAAEEALDDLNNGDLYKAMEFLGKRLHWHPTTSAAANPNFIKAFEALRNHISQEVVGGNFSLEDMTWKGRFKGDNVRVPKGTELPDGSILGEEVTMTPLVSGIIVMKKPDGSVTLLDPADYDGKLYKMLEDLDVHNFENTPSQEEIKYGLNVHAVLEFGRHEIPGKTPEGMSADYLTPEGQASAKERGKKIKERNVAAYSSPKDRAQETVDLEIQSSQEFSDKAVNVINKKISELSEGLLREGSQKGTNEFKVKIAKELDTVVGFNKIMSQAQEWAKKEVANGSKRSLNSLLTQFYLDNPELCEKEGVTTPHEAATQIAYRAARELGMTERFLNDTDVRLVNITHGPKLEPFLLEVIDDFKTLEEMGDSFNPGESFEFEVQTDQNGQKSIKLNFRGKSYDVNDNSLSKLASEYREKLLKKREDNK